MKTSSRTEAAAPLVLKADKRPLDVEHVVSDDVGFAVLHKEPEVVHGLLNIVLTQNISDKAQVYVSCKIEKIEIAYSICTRRI